MEHYRKIELGMYGLQRENMLILYKKYKIDPSYLLTGEKNHTFDVEMFLANCSREEIGCSEIKTHIDYHQTTFVFAYQGIVEEDSAEHQSPFRQYLVTAIEEGENYMISDNQKSLIDLIRTLD